MAGWRGRISAIASASQPSLSGFCHWAQRTERECGDCHGVAAETMLKVQEGLFAMVTGAALALSLIQVAEWLPAPHQPVAIHLQKR